MNLSTLNILIALLMTLVIETPIYYLLLKIYKNNKIKDILTIILMNIVTNLSLNILLLFIPNNLLIILFLEGIIFLIEGIIIFLIINRSFFSFLYATISNLISYLLGLIYSHFIYIDILNSNNALNILSTILIAFIVIFVIETLIIFLIKFIKYKNEKKEEVK